VNRRLRERERYPPEGEKEISAGGISPEMVKGRYQLAFGVGWDRVRSGEVLR